MQNIKKIAFYLILFLPVLACHYSYAAEETATKAATVRLEAIVGKTIEGLSVAGPYVGVVYQSLSIAVEIKSHAFPNEEEAAHANAIAERYALLTAENEFQSCLMKNSSSLERSRSGRPTACEGIASMLIVLGGKDEVNRITTIYNQFRK